MSRSPHVGARARCWRLGAWRLSPHACFMSPPPQQIFPLDCSPRVGGELWFVGRLAAVSVGTETGGREAWGRLPMKIRIFEIMYFIHSSEPRYS